MHVLITGGFGYIGSVLATHLIARGNKVRVLDELWFGGKMIVPPRSTPHDLRGPSDAIVKIN